MGALTGHTPASTYGDLIQAGNAGAGVPSTLQQIQDGLGNNTGLFLSQSQIGIAGSDIGMKRVAAKVAAMTDGGGTNLAWLQEAGYQALAAAYTNATATFSNTNFSFNVIAGRSYQIAGLILAGNSTAGEGAKFDFNGGGATITTFNMAFQSINGTNTPGTLVSSTLAGVINWTSLTATNYIQVMGLLKVNAGGTLIMRAAENSTAVGTMTISAGSWLSLTDTPTV